MFALCRGVAQTGSALEWGSRGRWFKSNRPDQFLKIILIGYTAVAVTAIWAVTVS